MRSANTDTIEAWNTVLFDKFARYRAVVAAMLAPHGQRAVDLLDARPGARVIDLGCGFGDTTRVLADRVGAGGLVVGVDCAERYLDVARHETPAGAPIAYVSCDLEAEVPRPGGLAYDGAYARFGTMFFARPVVALRNVRHALRPGGRLAMAVWRRKDSNECLHAAELAVRELLGDPPRDDQVTCGPGPFSMASADVVTDQLLAAGYRDVSVTRSDARSTIAETLDAAVDVSLELGPAGEVVRLAGAAAVARAGELRARVGAALAPYRDPAGRIVGATSAWIACATNP